MHRCWLPILQIQSNSSKNCGFIRTIKIDSAGHQSKYTKYAVKESEMHNGPLSKVHDEMDGFNSIGIWMKILDVKHGS